MTVLRDFFCRLFLICAAALMCEVLGENMRSSGAKGIQAAVKTVCALCVCVTVFSFFGKLESNPPMAQNAPNHELYPDEAVESPLTKAQPNITPILEKTKAALENRIADAVFEKCGIKPQDVCINWTIGNEPVTEVAIASVSLTFADNISPEITDSAADFAHQLLFGT